MDEWEEIHGQAVVRKHLVNKKGKVLSLGWARCRRCQAGVCGEGEAGDEHVEAGMQEADARGDRHGESGEWRSADLPTHNSSLAPFYLLFSVTFRCLYLNPLQRLPHLTRTYRKGLYLNLSKQEQEKKRKEKEVGEQV